MDQLFHFPGLSLFHCINVSILQKFLNSPNHSAISFFLFSRFKEITVLFWIHHFEKRLQCEQNCETKHKTEKYTIKYITKWARFIQVATGTVYAVC